MNKFYTGKPCRNCGGTKRYKSTRGCVACQNAREVTPTQRRKYHLSAKYGLSPSEYDTMMVEQANGCAICGNSDKRLHVDHDHATGKVRGLLCMECNVSLGKFKDSPELLRKAIVYLETE